MKLSKPKDRDFIETIEGYLFCVVGYLHPADGYTAYLKYIPSQEGLWEREGIRYSRSIPYYQVSQVENTYTWLKENHPEYILKCPVRDIEVSWVPKNKVKKYYHPIDRLEEIKKKRPKDPLENRLIKLVSLLEDSTEIEDSIGVTGSILTGTHNPKFSDLDLTVYGSNESYEVKKALLELKETSKEIKDISSQEKRRWIQNRLNKHGLNKKELARIAEKRWNFGYIDGIYFSIHPTRTDNEITENYGDNMYHRIKEVSGTATISENKESIYLPAVYKIIECKPDRDISEIISFEGLYSSLFDNGEKIEFNGILEEIKGKRLYKRIIIGGAGSPNSNIKWSYSG
jgi:predicted nucleotidyltransferase